MSGLLLSLRSEFYKSRKTFGFWGAVVLPVAICALVFLGFYNHSERLESQPGMMLWFNLSMAILAVMGNLLLPIYIIFVSYSVNSIEHKADTWKTLFSLPISKWSVYTAKYLYALILVIICLTLFFALTLATGDLLNTLAPNLKFHEYSIAHALFQVYVKLFFSSLGILSIQFLLSLLWSDFIKPMGVGFICTIAGLICTNLDWKYAYLLPYSHPALTIRGLFKSKMDANGVHIDLFTQEIYVSFIVAAVFFVLGYFIVQRRSVK